MQLRLWRHKTLANLVANGPSGVKPDARTGLGFARDAYAKIMEGGVRATDIESFQTNIDRLEQALDAAVVDKV